MNTAYKPVDRKFYDELQALAKEKAYVRIQFYTDIHEFLTINASLKGLHQQGEEEYLLVSTGEEIRLDRLVRVGNTAAPGYDEDYFKCDC
ncbi:hypothetical protein [Botryobacter ruber]|uniref:hypothetical protein n=1 Tax=Botryobacter ruber TaxID=2171629 RepID=UPI000E0BD38F|nr:hypothetical protein [Botryobacter ruber]